MTEEELRIRLNQVEAALRKLPWLTVTYLMAERRRLQAQLEEVKMIEYKPDGSND